MRGILAVSLSVLLFVLACGYCITWYGQSVATKRAIEQFVADINKGDTYLTYDALETSGFPAEVNVSIIRPHFKGAIDPLLQQAYPGKSFPKWIEDVLIDGRITIGVNALSDRYTMHAHGKTVANETIGGEPHASLASPKTDITCALQLQRNAGLFDDMWNFNLLNRDAKALAADFRTLDCSSTEGSTLDAKTNEPVSNTGPFRFYIANTPLLSNDQLRVYIKGSGMEITPKGNELVASYYKILSPAAPVSVDLASYGKENIEVDFSYFGPGDFKNMTKNPTLDINLSRCDITNLVYNFHTTFHLKNIPDGTNRKTQLSYKGQSQFSQQYDKLFRYLLRNFANEIYTNPDPKLAELKAWVQKFTPAQLYSMAEPVIPQFYSLGTMTTKFEGSYTGVEDFSAGDYILSGLELSATPYGITANGDAKLGKTLLPSGNFHLTCTNCLALVDDVNNYLSRVKIFMQSIHPEIPASYALSPAGLAGFKQFLTAIAATAKPGDKTYLFNVKGNGPDILINDKPLADVNALYVKYFPAEPLPVNMLNR